MHTVAQRRSAHFACSNWTFATHSTQLLQPWTRQPGTKRSPVLPTGMSPSGWAEGGMSGKKDGDGGLGSDWSSVGRAEEWTTPWGQAEGGREQIRQPLPAGLAQLSAAAQALPAQGRSGRSRRRRATGPGCNTQVGLGHLLPAATAGQAGPVPGPEGAADLFAGSTHQGGHRAGGRSAGGAS